MKTRFSLRPLVSLALLLTLGCCKKDDPKPPAEQLPAATTSGADTWGCLVNGEVWQGCGASKVGGDWTTSDGVSITMGFTTYVGNQPQAHNVLLSFADTTNSFTLPPGTYILPNGGGLNGAILQTPARRYRADKLISGVAHLTRLDRQAAIVSGTFEFTMVGGPGDTVRVTNGRFDGHMDL